jgi:hypothetical protein
VSLSEKRFLTMITPHGHHLLIHFVFFDCFDDDDDDDDDGQGGDGAKSSNLCVLSFFLLRFFSARLSRRLFTALQEAAYKKGQVAAVGCSKNKVRSMF